MRIDPRTTAGAVDGVTGVTGLLGKRCGFGCCPRQAPLWRALSGG